MKCMKFTLGCAELGLRRGFLFHRVGLGIATANARPEVKREAHWVTHNVGGSGAVRDAIEMIFHARGFWDEILDHYEVKR